MIMSGMFYSLEEAAEKLSKSKDEVKKLVKSGQLREFRDGPNILFKAEEIEALIPDKDVSGPSEIEEPLEILDETEIHELAPEESESEVIDEIDIPEFTAEESEPQAIEEEMEIPELSAEETTEEVSDEEPLTLKPEPEAQEKPEEDFIDFNSETAITEIPEEDSEDKKAPADDSLSSILLDSETGAPVDSNDLTDGDTAVIGQGTSILGLTDNKEYDLTEDTMADTVVLDGTKGGSTGLEEIEEDVSLDSFGSGSGLLDLSLQADDTSLGGILDEIYTDENKEPGLSEPKEQDMDAGTGAEQETPAGIGDEALAPQLEATPAMAFGVGAVELPPDSQSNILGMLLFIPLASVLFAAIVTLAGTRDILPSILTMVEDFIWFIMGGLAAITVAASAAAFMLTGERTPKVKKEKVAKVKKEKAPKVKKEKAPKVKKEKPPKPDKKAKKK